MIPAPNLDDREFQDLVDDARRLVQQRCPQWSDHNISDPGITLIETFAMMMDQLIYRLNRVPDRNYLKFLELIGMELRPPGVAAGTATFWLSAPQPHTITVRAETEVSTDRTDIEEPIVFSTVSALNIVPCSRKIAAVTPAGRDPADRTEELRSAGFGCFSAQPVPGDALLVGLSNAVPSCAVLLRVDCSVAGVGVNPDHPPLIWEAWTGTGWSACELGSDGTGAFNQAGDVILHVPAGHTESVLAGHRQGWLRCRLLDVGPTEPTYTHSPFIKAISAVTMGGTTRVINARVVRDEVVGISDGTAAQRFPLMHRPVVNPGESRLAIVDRGQVSDWRYTGHFAGTGGNDQVFHVDAAAGELVFGPALREADGSLSHYGAVPPKGATIRMTSYLTGGGTQGNISINKIHILKTSVPYIATVENRHAAVGGSGAETVEDLKTRGPLVLRSRGRAVTAEDFEYLASETAPELARVHCLTSGGAANPEAGAVRLVVVPHVASDSLGRVKWQDLQPAPETVERVGRYLDERRLAGTRLVINRPAYQGLTVVVGVRALSGFPSDAVRDDILRALYRLFHPLRGGPAGTGWPIGRAVQSAEVGAALAWIPGVNMAEEITVKLFPADAETGRRDNEVARLQLAPDALVYSHAHQVRVLR